jgi:hypothetical protein
LVEIVAAVESIKNFCLQIHLDLLADVTPQLSVFIASTQKLTPNKNIAKNQRFPTIRTVRGQLSLISLCSGSIPQLN